MVAVPRRKVNAEFEAMPLTCFGDFAHHIPVSVPERTVLHIVFGILAWPKTKPVVMLAANSAPFKASILQDSCPLIRVRFRAVKNFHSLVAHPPPPVRKHLGG